MGPGPARLLGDHRIGAAAHQRRYRALIVLRIELAILLGRRHFREPRRRGRRQCRERGGKVVRRKILRVAAEHFECAEDDLEIENGEVSIVGVPENRSPSVSLPCAPIQCACGPARHRTWSRIHAIFRTAARRDRKRCACDDRGGRSETLMLQIRICRRARLWTVIKSLILAGQIHGGVAKGIGNAFYEELCSMPKGSCSMRRSRIIPAERHWTSRAWSSLDTTTTSPLNPSVSRARAKLAPSRSGHCLRKRSRMRSIFRQAGKAMRESAQSEPVWK